MENQQQISNMQNQQTAHQQDAESTISLKDIVFLVITTGIGLPYHCLYVL